MARLQARAFHESSSFAPLDSLLYYAFQVGPPHLQQSIGLALLAHACMSVRRGAM